MLKNIKLNIPWTHDVIAATQGVVLVFLTEKQEYVVWRYSSSVVFSGVYLRDKRRAWAKFIELGGFSL